MVDLKPLLGSGIRTLKLQLEGIPGAEGVRPVLVLLGPDGMYEWTSYGTNGAALLEMFGSIIVGLAQNQQPPTYYCRGCSTPGQQHGKPPQPGWSWTPSGAFLCPACRAELDSGPVVQLVPRGTPLDAPDLAQAPSNLGTGPVPLFLDGEDELDAEWPTSLSEQQLEVSARLAELQQIKAAWEKFMFRAPETWSPEEAQVVRRYHELEGLSLRPELQEFFDQRQRAALEAEARRLNEQERNGG